MVDAFEKRDIATVDTPGAFFQTNIPNGEDKVHLILNGQMAELLAKIAPEAYQDYIHQQQGQVYIYCCVNVAISGTLKAALLFWKKLSCSLEQRDYVIHPSN